MRGAPPRVRGRHPLGDDVDAPARSTPARAGPTPSTSPVRAGTWEHPRACGADLSCIGAQAGPVGAPPRVRGRLRRRARGDPGERSTPARAGPTSRQSLIAASPPEHPRACGADPRGGDRVSIIQGAPPRVRGRHPAGADRVAVAGSTPARAGPTRRRGRRRRGRPEHPRACGADGLVKAGVTEQVGAPPRVRGRLPRRAQAVPPDGSTPARAGPTPTCSTPRCPTREHPRACGADTVKVIERHAALGAPPRVRGRQPEPSVEADADGSTPARAGPTQGPSRSTTSGSEHPRACGADSGISVHSQAAAGAPPRVRGRRRRLPHRRPGGGSTPARAGPTCPRR